jgi:hypothetical protein
MAIRSSVPVTRVAVSYYAHDAVDDQSLRTPRSQAAVRTSPVAYPASYPWGDTTVVGSILEHLSQRS